MVAWRGAVGGRCTRCAHVVGHRRARGGRNRFLSLAPQGDTPVRITHFRVGDSQCQFCGRRGAQRAAQLNARPAAWRGQRRHATRIKPAMRMRT